MIGQSYNYIHLDVHDGLPQMQVNSVNLDRKGHLWISTRGGISRFDGNNFENFEDVDCLPKVALASSESKNGHIWILSPDYLIEFDGTNCTSHSLPENIHVNYTSKLTCLANRTILGSSSNKNEAWVFKNNNFISASTFFQLPKHNHIIDIALDSINDIIIANYLDGIRIFQDTLFQKYFEFEKPNPRAFFLNSSSHYINENQIIPYDNGFYYFNEDFSLVKNCTHGALGLGLCKMEENGRFHDYVSLDKNALVITDTKLEKQFQINNSKSKFNKIGNILEFNKTKVISSDRGLNIWPNERFYNYSEIELPYIWAIAEGKDQEIYVGGYGSGTFLIDNNQVTPLSTEFQYCKHPSHKRNSKITSNRIYFGSSKDKDDNIYFSTERGINKISDQKSEMWFNTCKIFKDNTATLYNLYDPDKNCLISCHCDGVAWINIKDKEIVDTLFKKDLGNKSCILTAIKHDNAYFFGSRPHVTRYDGIKTETLKQEKDSLNNTFICSMVDHENNLWFGSSNGLYKVKKDSLIKIPFLENETISAITQFSKDKVFLSTKEGLIMWNLEKYLKDTHIIYKLFDEKNGYTSIEPNQNGLFIDSSQKLWITSSTALSYCYPISLSYESERQISIGINSINNKYIHLSSDTYAIESGKNDVEVETYLIGIEQPENTKLSYSLCDQDFTFSSKNKFINLQNLSSGKHQIRIKITDDNDLLIAERKIFINVDVPIFKEPWWPLFLLSIIFGVVIYTLYKWYSYKILESAHKELIFEKSELGKINEDLNIKIKKLKEQHISGTGILEFKSPNKVYRIPSTKISFIKAENNGCRIYYENNSFWTADSLKSIKKQIPENIFTQIHRSTLINIAHVQWINNTSLKLHSGEELNIGRTYKETILSMVKNHLAG